ncbi:TIGR03619 family F420-dependent LLM class oxidoreductase [Streptomyces auratus]|uniref:TIGR03619 family F420-dependent LLM class oxidoreductase n=1 Tax=Streptomyces auratus AGR0001 TaxID=1160718 RepID=A0A8B1NRB7_9ACTN|nr:TIGR03619 family F420-dependent LLM class oxidoreductase [Streptomyces auratus]QTZ93816.1 TIGR03619 family F420-dependent LLM class oxidoreductase [Streptomyces auratus AGR0001]
MELHATLPAERPDADPRELADLAQLAEELGYGGLTLPDHLFTPRPPEEGYGGSFDAFVTLGYLAAVTEHIELALSVLVLPLRNPYVVAKQAATLARLSGDRFVLGIGVGWERFEFDATGADFTTRGARTDSALRLIRNLHTTGGAAFDDPRYGHPGGYFTPVPHRPVPIMVGGVSDAALRRAARHGDRWQSHGIGPEDFVERATHLRSLADCPVATDARISIARGSAAEAAGTTAAELDTWAATGAERLTVWFGPDVTTAAERMRALATHPQAHPYLVR